MAHFKKSKKVVCEERRDEDSEEIRKTLDPIYGLEAVKNFAPTICMICDMVPC